MASANWPPQRREIVVRGEGNCFYRAVPLWRDETSDKKHEEIRRLSSSFTEKNPNWFLSRFFSLRTLWRNMPRTARSRELGQKLWIYSVAHDEAGRDSKSIFSPNGDSSSTKGTFLVGSLSLCFRFLDFFFIFCRPDLWSRVPSHLQCWCRTFGDSVTLLKVIWADLCTLFQREKERFDSLGTFDHYHKPTQHNDRHQTYSRCYLYYWD